MGHRSDENSLELLREKYRPVFQRIAEGIVERESSRTLPYEQITWLKESGFTAVRVPRRFGGDEASLPDLFALLIELATADPHIPQALRGHFAFVEDQLNREPSAARDEWLERFAAGEIVGNAVTEIGSVTLGDTRTRVIQENDGLVVTGSKFYTTGSIFSEWIDVFALDPAGVEVAALVSTRDDRVTVTDDWDGFGQRLTGSGTAVFNAAPVRFDHIYPFHDRFFYQTAMYQVTLVAVLAGIARGAAQDAVHQVANRARAFSHGNSPEMRRDPQVLEIVGRVCANAAAVEAITVSAAEALERAFQGRSGSPQSVAALKREAELRSAEAQVVVTRLTMEAAQSLFDGLGASATVQTQLLDRHWRNARTVSSHNPVAFKARIVGDWFTNGVEPPYEWAIGVSRPKQSAGE